MKIKPLSLLLGLVLSTSTTLAQAENLDEIFQLALTKDPQVLRAAATVDVNKEGIVQAKSALYPNISLALGASKTVTRSSALGPNAVTGINERIFTRSEGITTSYGFTLTQNIFDLSTWQTLDRSEKVALQSVANYQQAKQNLIVRVSDIYFAVLKAEDQLELAVAEKNAIERQLEQTNQRFKVGLTAITDVHEAQSKFDASVATVIRSENNVEIQKEALREITGQYHPNLAELNTERFSTAKLEKSPEDWVNVAKTNNQDLHALTIAMDIAKQDIDIAFSGHLPTLSLTATKGRRNNNAEATRVGSAATTYDNPYPTDTKSLRLDLNVPIFSGFRADSRVKQAQASYVVASENRELTYRSVVRSIRTSYANVITLISTIKAQEQAVISAESALKATEAGFEVGTRTIVDVLDSTRALFSAKRNLSSSRYDYILAVLQLKQAAGTITGEDVEKVSQGLQEK
jgi:outer membrane protein